MKHVVTASVGGIALRFSCGAAALPLLDVFRAFPCEPDASPAIDIDLDLHDACTLDDGATLSLTTREDGALWLTGPSTSAVIAADNAHAQLVAPAVTQPLHALVRLVLARALLERDALLVHASAVVTERGSAAVFVGASGAGKSTIASALPYVVAADEAVGITCAVDDDTPIVFGTPWWRGTPVRAPLHTLAFIARGEPRRWQNVARARVAAKLLSAAGPLPDHDAARAFAIATRIAARAPIVADATLATIEDITSFLAPHLDREREAAA